MPTCLPYPVLAVAEARQAFAFLEAVAQVAETTPLEARENAWESALKGTRPAGIIFEGERIGSLLGVWRAAPDLEGRIPSLVSQASDRLRAGDIRMHVFSHAAFSAYLRGLNEPLPSNIAAVEGHHRRAEAPESSARIFLRDTFTRSNATLEVASLRLAANALHETIHLVGPADPLVSECCAFAYDTSLRLYYGDHGFYDTVRRLDPEPPHRFERGLLTYIQNAYR